MGIWPNRVPWRLRRLHRKARKSIAATVWSSVGCSNGNDPTLLATRITSARPLPRPANIEAQGAPVEGRSGGGLFNAKGELIGVCFAADYEGNEGLYAALDSIHDELAARGLGDISSAAAETNQSSTGGSAPPAAIVRGQEPLDSGATGAGTESPRRRSPQRSRLILLHADGRCPSSLSEVEQAAWEEIMTRASIGRSDLHHSAQRTGQSKRGDHARQTCRPNLSAHWPHAGGPEKTRRR